MKKKSEREKTKKVDLKKNDFVRLPLPRHRRLPLFYKGFQGVGGK